MEDCLDESSQYIWMARGKPVTMLPFTFILEFIYLFIVIQAFCLFIYKILILVKLLKFYHFFKYKFTFFFLGGILPYLPFNTEDLILLCEIIETFLIIRYYRPFGLKKNNNIIQKFQ